MNFQRSAIDPVGIVAVVSINTIWKRNRVMAAASYALPVRKKPLNQKPKGFPNRFMINS